MKSERYTRKMLSISINWRDGGIMVVPHLQNWGVITSSQLVASKTGRLVPDEPNYVSTGGENRPKLHYHRSGMTSVQPQLFTGRMGRKTIHLPSLDQLDAVQIFAVTARLPGLLPWDQQGNAWDIIQILDSPRARSLQLSGVIYDRKKIDGGSIGGMTEAGPISLASDHRNAILVDLSGYGLESVMGLYFNASMMELPSFAADFTLTSFNPETLGTNGAVAIHAGPGWPYLSLQGDIPAVSSIHRVDALSPVKSYLERRQEASIDTGQAPERRGTRRPGRAPRNESGRESG